MSYVVGIFLLIGRIAKEQRADLDSDFLDLAYNAARRTRRDI